MKKRKSGTQASVAKVFGGPQGSRFAACPCCARNVPIATLNWHLDHDCGAPAPPAACGAAPAVLPPPPQSPGIEARAGGSPALQQEPQAAPAYPRRAGKEPAGDAHSSEAAADAPSSWGSGGGARGPKWWQSRPAAAVTAFGPGGQSAGSLTPAALMATAHCELVPDFLPAELADALLLRLMADSPGWARMQWWIGEAARQPALSSKTSCHYMLAEGGGGYADQRQAEAFAQQGQQQQQHHHQHQQQQRQQPQQQQQGYEEEGYGGVPQAAAPPPLRLAADMVSSFVSDRIRAGAAASLPLEAADRRGWQPTYAIANCYADGGSGIGAHSDRLTGLGPCPIIASLTLGATRVFRLHRQQAVELQGGAGNSSGGGAAAAAAGVARVDVELPHNTLCVLWPPNQEAWKHEIPKTTRPFPTHRLSGAVRYNLTFRRHKPEWEARAPPCHCGRRSSLRARHPKQGPQQPPVKTLRYHYVCDSAQGPSCKFWQDGPSVAL